MSRLDQRREAIVQSEYVHVGSNVSGSVGDDVNIVLTNLSNNMGNLSGEILVAAAEGMILLMEEKDNKQHPFFLFLPAVDLSWSVLSGMSHEDKITGLTHALSQYMVHRYATYHAGEVLGTLSLIAKDRGSSRKNGESARYKITRLCEEKNISITNATDIADMNDNEVAFVDKQHKHLLIGLLEMDQTLDPTIKASLIDKKPDFLIRKNGEFILIEHKHLKESGGAQDKQFKEVEDFYDKASSVSSISKAYGFIDGYYYNKLLQAESEYEASNETIQKNKLHKSIRKMRSFFASEDYIPIINTEKFIEIIS